MLWRGVVIVELGDDEEDVWVEDDEAEDLAIWIKQRQSIWSSDTIEDNQLYVCITAYLDML